MSDIDNAALQNIWEALLGIQDAIEALNPERHMSQTCQHHRCSYFTDYLAMGPADLTHEGYHAAEKKNEEAQKAQVEWCRKHPAITMPEDAKWAVETWERRLRL